MIKPIDRDEAIDLLAKLLANEDLTVVRQGDRTARFNIVTRVLYLPRWKDMTFVLDQMLSAHEIGHALYTTMDFYEGDEANFKLKFKGAKRYCNILEDARIEKLVKRKYPGIRRLFNAGYVELCQRGFFGDADPNTLGFLDRINIAFKVGRSSGVQFADDEMPFVERVESLETIDEVLRLAQDIYDFLKTKEEAKRKEQEQKQPAPTESEDESEEEDDSEDESGIAGPSKEEPEDDSDESETDDQESEADESTDSDDESEDESGDSAESEDDSDESEDDDRGTEGAEEDDTDVDGDDSDDADPSSEEDAEGNGGVTEEDSEPELPTTDETFDSKLDATVDTKSIVKTWSLAKFRYDPILTYKEIAATLNAAYGPADAFQRTRVATFRHNTQNNVDYLVKEFEMRKAATAYKRTTVAKSGSLDMKKLWAYKLNDDLFRRVSVIKDGKNHGMVFLLDWSSSMSETLSDTIDQLINLVLFCQRIGIPYRVYAFSNDERVRTKSCVEFIKTNPAELENTIDGSLQYGSLNPDYRKVENASFLTLLELFNSNMTAQDFNEALINLKSDRLRRYYRLASTPLNQALIFMYDFIGLFKAAHNLERVSFITLTDGESDSLGTRFELSRKIAGAYTTYLNKFKAPHMRTAVDISHSNKEQTQVLLTAIKTRYNCAVIGFYVLRSTGLEYVARALSQYAVVADINPYTRRKKYLFHTEEAKQSTTRLADRFKEEGFLPVKAKGYDEMFLIPPTPVSSDKLSVAKGATVRALAKSFRAHMEGKKKSRVLLGRFIDWVA